MKRYFEEEEWIMFAAWKTKKWINLEDIFCVHEAIKMKISSLFVTYVHVWKKKQPNMLPSGKHSFERKVINCLSEDRNCTEVS